MQFINGVPLSALDMAGENSKSSSLSTLTSFLDAVAGNAPTLSFESHNLVEQDVEAFEAMNEDNIDMGAAQYPDGDFDEKARVAKIQCCIM